MTSYFGIGLMSGNSVDGLDLCYAEYLGNMQSDVWSYRIIKAETKTYNEKWRRRLRMAHRLNGPELIQLNADFGRFIGLVVKDFIERENILDLDFVASNGHTAFHQPSNGLTFSLGDGERIVTYLPCPLVTNFRSKDIELGGQGRPLVPMADPYLYQNYDFCLNLGGISYITHKTRAFDVCPCNILLNYLARLQNSGTDYDLDGEVARSGKILTDLLSKLDNLAYYSQHFPKSLCREWFDTEVLPLLDHKTCPLPDLLRTSVEHIVNQIVKAVQKFPKRDTTPDTIGSPNTSRNGQRYRTILVTGGGANNKFLMERLHAGLEEEEIRIADCDTLTLEYKEALVYAFLGMRCLLGLPNISKDITGGDDIVSGSIHLPPHYNRPTLLLK